MTTSRATVYQTVQSGPETTPGTVVAATHRHVNLVLDPTPNIPVKEVKHPGSKVTTDIQVGQEFTDFSYSGALDFNSLTYILASMFGDPGTTTPQVGGLGRQRIYAPSPNQPIALPQTYTIEHGSSKGAEQYTFFMYSDLAMVWNKTEANISGKAFGQKAARNFTPTPALPRIAPRAVQPKAIGVYLSIDGMTYTKALTDLDGEFHFNGLWAPTFHVNDTVQTYDTVHERMPDFGGTLTVEEGSEADNFMSYLENGQQIWVGIQAMGPIIDPAVTGGTPLPAVYSMLKFRLPVFITKPAPGDKSEIWGNTFTFMVADDDVALAKVTLINKLAAL